MIRPSRSQRSSIVSSVNHFQITLQSGADYAQTRGTVTLTLIGTLKTVTVTFDKYVLLNDWTEKSRICPSMFSATRPPSNAVQLKIVSFHWRPTSATSPSSISTSRRPAISFHRPGIRTPGHSHERRFSMPILNRGKRRFDICPSESRRCSRSYCPAQTVITSGAKVRFAPC